jgi:hypothetical protein
MNKPTVVHSYNEFYSLIIVNELTVHEKTWKKLKCILLSERSQFERGTTCIIPMYAILETAKLRDRTRTVVVRVSGGGREG